MWYLSCKKFWRASRLVHSGGTGKRNVTEPTRTEKYDKPPDLVILTTKAVDPSVRPYVDYNEVWTKGPDDLRQWEQIAAVAEFTTGTQETFTNQSIEARDQIERRLFQLSVTPVRTHSYGFTVVNTTLIIYLLTPSGLFHSPAIECTHVTLVTLLYRLLHLSDTELGVLAFDLLQPLTPLSPPLKLPYPPLNNLTPTSLRPPSAPPLLSTSISEVVFRRFKATGRATSAFRAECAYGDGSRVERAVSLVFTESERERNEESCRIQDLIAKATLEERKGLSRTLECARSEFSLGPELHSEDLHEEEEERRKIWEKEREKGEKDKLVTPPLVYRSVEWTVHEECFESIYTVKSTRELVVVLIGALEGLRSLHALGFVHGDPSDANIMIDSNKEGRLIDYNLSLDKNRTETTRLERSGTFPFLARAVLKGEKSFRHELWHDVESIIYVCIVVAFRTSPAFGDDAKMSNEARSFWTSWRTDGGRISKESLCGARGRNDIVNAFQPGWDGLGKVLEVVYPYCGLTSKFTEFVSFEENDKELAKPWREGTTEEETLIKLINELKPPLHPVLSTKSGHVYEKELVLKYLKDNEGRDPVTGEALTEDDLVEVKTAPSTPAAPPRPPTFTSVPALLHVLQGEWDSVMLECLELRKQGAELRQELSHALYKEDAAMRVLARITRERDEARSALASVKATLGAGFSAEPSAGGDVEMEVEAEAAAGGLTGDAKSRVEATVATLSGGRKKRKAAEGHATAADIEAYTTSTTIPSLHGTKPPGVSAIGLAKDASLIVTGGLDKNVQIYDRETSKILSTLKGHTKKVTAVVATKGLTDDALPKFVVSSSLDKAVRVWFPNGNKTVYGSAGILTTGGEVNALSLHPSDSLVASASSDGTWSIHDLTTAKPSTLLTVSLPEDAPEGTANTAIAFHPDGGLIAVGSSDSTIRIFEAISTKCVATFPGHSEVGGGAIAALAFSENGYNLASSAASSAQVKIWDLRKLSNSGNIDLAEGAVVNALEFDSSASFLAAAGTDLRVYANKTWAQLLVTDDNASELTGVSWGALGKEIVTSGLDRTVRIVAPKAE
ncbi:pre-mRNA-processing factor 19 [Pseudohyphozyma bogoriensis]|nr:pre-mRNA-processing factor 19 [Pseudohyphozyma bogoriensis]